MAYISEYEKVAQLLYEHALYQFSQEFPTKKMAEPLCVHFRRFEGPLHFIQRAYENLVDRISKTHCIVLEQSGGVCSNRLAHISLYAAARIASFCDLPNTDVIVRLLSEIFCCDKTFRNLLLGAFHDMNCLGINVYTIFDSQDEAVSAMEYFLEHTSKAKMVFIQDGVPRRMVDLILQEDCFGNPATYETAYGWFRVLKLLVQYGANLNYPSDSTKKHSVQDMIDWIISTENYEDVKVYQDLLNREHPELLPIQEQTLMRLARKSIRKQLNKNFQLPSGIDLLPIPQELKSFLHLDYD